MLIILTNCKTRSSHSQRSLLSHVPSYSLDVSRGEATAVLVNMNGTHNHYSSAEEDEEKNLPLTESLNTELKLREQCDYSLINVSLSESHDFNDLLIDVVGLSIEMHFFFFFFFFLQL